MTTGDDVGDALPILSVNYEIQRLQGYHDRLLLSASAKGEKDLEAINAFLEAFLIHYRNLLNFLGSKAGGDDIKAIDLVPGFQSTLSPEHYRARINKRLAHLSRSRPEYPKEWHFGKMLIEIRDAWDEFIEQALAAVEEEQTRPALGGVGCRPDSPPKTSLIRPIRLTATEHPRVQDGLGTSLR